MKDEKDILNYFNGDLVDQKLQQFKQRSDFDAIHKIGYYAKQISVPNFDEEKLLNSIKEGTRKVKDVKVRTLNFKTYYRVAAVFLLTLVSTYFLFFNQNAIHKTDFAETKSVILPDASEVIINAKSRLAYNKKKWARERDLELDGEAFFKVSKGNTFTVNTALGKVEVLGTEFNVNQRDGFFEVKCYEGLVEVTYSDKSVKLSKGKALRLVNGELVPLNDFASPNPSWIYNESTFERIPLKLVMAELERQFNIKIEAQDVNKEQLYSGTFTHNDVNLALQSVTIPLNLSYRIKDKNVVFYNYE